MGQSGFTLRKWVTNSKELKRKIDLHEEDKGNKKNVVRDHESYAKLSLGVIEHDSKDQKVLGQAWDNDTDELKFDFRRLGKGQKP